MSQIEKNVSKFIECLKEQENKLRQKANFCNEHNFKKEEEYIRSKLQIIQEIRFESELILEPKDNRPLFNF